MATLPSLTEIIKIIFKLILLLILSWFGVHLFSLLGGFIAVGFLIWWLLFPKYSICLYGRTRKVGDYCKLCKHTIEHENERYPRTFQSALYNTGILFVITILSSILVYTEYKILTLVINPTSSKTVSFVIPSESQHRVGEVFPLKIELKGIEVPINAIQADIGFDTQRLEVVDISTKDSFATVFLQKEINNDLGYARLSGGLPNPGFNAPSGLFGTVYFKGKTAGLAQVFFLDSSLVLANDGKGTNVIKEFSTLSYLITPEELPIDQQELQNTLILDDVLGIEKEPIEGQILLFEEDSETNVLGVEDTIQENLNEQKPTFFDRIVEIITEIDSFIIDRIEWIFSLFSPSKNE